MAKKLTTDEKFNLLFKEIKDLKEENKKLKREVTRLKSRLSKYETPRNSSNSNKPPSSDFPKQRKAQSLLSSSGRKPGGQPGHKGNTLKMVKHPY